MAQNSLLTDSQREFVKGEGDGGGAAERMARKRLRERVRQGLADFATLVEHADNDLLEDIIEDVEGDSDPEAALPHLVAFVFRHHSEVHRTGPHDLEDAVAEGAETGAWAMGYSTSANVQISLTTLEPVDDVIAGIQNRLEKQGVGGISFDELQELRDSGELAEEEYNELHVKKTERLRERAKERVDEGEEHFDEKGFAQFGFLGEDEAPFFFDELERRGPIGEDEGEEPDGETER